MLLIPAIDLINGQCVRLTEGNFDQKKIYSHDPVEQARIFKGLGAKRIHIVDLDGAKSGQSVNREIIKKIKKETGLIIQTGGGIRSEADVNDLISAGIDYLILGTMLVENFDLVLKLARENRARFIAGIDVKNNAVKTRGWKEGQAMDPIVLGKKIHAIGINSAVYTDISKDGKLEGPNLTATQKFLESGLNVILSGGISRLDDIKHAVRMMPSGLLGIIIGKAYYENKIDLKQAINQFNKDQ